MKTGFPFVLPSWDLLNGEKESAEMLGDNSSSIICSGGFCTENAKINLIFSLLPTDYLYEQHLC